MEKFAPGTHSNPPPHPLLFVETKVVEPSAVEFKTVIKGSIVTLVGKLVFRKFDIRLVLKIEGQELLEFRNSE